MQIITFHGQISKVHNFTVSQVENQNFHRILFKFKDIHLGQKSVDHNGVEADDEEKRKKVSKDEETHLKPRYICDMILRGPSFISKLPNILSS